MRSFIPKPAEIDRRWFVIDAEGLVLGRLASRIASILIAGILSLLLMPKRCA